GGRVSLSVGVESRELTVESGSGSELSTLNPQPSTVVLRVRDNGVGIPADLLPRVFDAFMQVETSLDRGQGGLGLGLSLVRNLVELHGERVEAYSEGEGRGSEFVVRLPALFVGPAQAAEPDPADGGEF